MHLQDGVLMANGIQSLGPDKPWSKRQLRLWDLMQKHSQERRRMAIEDDSVRVEGDKRAEAERAERTRKQEEKARQNLAFADTLQNIIRTSDDQEDLPVEYGASLGPIRETLLKLGAGRLVGYPTGVGGWYEPGLPLKKEEHPLPPFLDMLPRSAINTLGEFVDKVLPIPMAGEEGIHFKTSVGNSQGIMGHEFGHAFDFRNIISNELENKVIEEFWGEEGEGMLENESWYGDGREFRHKLWGHSEEFAPAFNSAVRYLQEGINPENLYGSGYYPSDFEGASPRFHTPDPNDPEGQPVSWKVPSYISTMVRELLKRPAYRNHPFNTSGLPVETWVNPENVEFRTDELARKKKEEMEEGTLGEKFKRGIVSLFGRDK